MRLTILSNAEQREEAIRAIVAATMEATADQIEMRGWWDTFQAETRALDACEWLSLCNLA